MDDIFKSKEDERREEKINNLFKSAGNFEEIKPPTVLEEENTAVAEPEKKNPKVFLNILLVLLFVGLAGAAGYFFWQYEKTLASANINNEAEIVAEKIGALTKLPEGKPALVTITDQEKITSQPFFAEALNGDKILLYVQSQKVILYRPSSNKIIGTASLFSESAAETEARLVEACAAQNTQKQAEKIEGKVRVDVLNGTEIKGLAKETADKLSGMENVELAKIGNAEKSNYTKILVVDISGKNAAIAKIIAQKLGGEIGSLPAGENKGTADILVISGK